MFEVQEREEKKEKKEVKKKMSTSRLGGKPAREMIICMQESARLFRNLTGPQEARVKLAARRAILNDKELVSLLFFRANKRTFDKLNHNGNGRYATEPGEPDIDLITAFPQIHHELGQGAFADVILPKVYFKSTFSIGDGQNLDDVKALLTGEFPISMADYKATWQPVIEDFVSTE